MVWIVRKWVAFVAGLFVLTITGTRIRPNRKLLRRMDYSTSTQRMGIRFSEHIRDIWRRRWLKLHR